MQVCFECGVGGLTKSSSEYGKRQDRFMLELDFVLADVVRLLLPASWLDG